MAVEEDHAAFAAPNLTPPPRMLIVVAPYYQTVARLLTSGAERALARIGARVDTIEVPGALEIGPAIALAADSGRYEGYVALGCVIRGETSHYDLVCAESARAVTWLSVARRLAIGNGVLTVENRDQALRRADPEQLDKGGGAAIAALQLIALARRLGAARPPRPRAADDDILLA